MTPTLNQGQQEAAKAFLDFLLDPDAKAFNISGPAGVGKTFLMDHLLSHVIGEYEAVCRERGERPRYRESAFTATTNKAAEVLSQSIGKPCQTIHSFLGLTLQEDWKTGEANLVRKKGINGWRVRANTLLAIDECSMVNRDLYEEIEATMMDSKILYVGDHCQMAPVKEERSPIYDRGYPFVRLETPVRNAGQPALMELCAQLRHTVETGEFLPLREVPGVIDWRDGEGLREEVEANFRELLVPSRILAHRNDSVIQYADYVRRTVRELPELYVPGERLVVGTGYDDGDNRLSVEAEVTVLAIGEPHLVEVDEDISIQACTVRLQTRYGAPIEAEYPVDRAHYRQCLAFLKRRKLWPRFFRLRDSFLDLRPADSCTVYKSQGSSYDSVFVDLEDISTSNIPSQVARLLYVAVSRARRRVVLRGHLAGKYGGEVIRAR